MYQFSCIISHPFNIQLTSLSCVYVCLHLQGAPGPRGPPVPQPGMVGQPQPGGGMPGMAPGMHPQQIGGAPQPRGPQQQGPSLMGAMPQPGQPQSQPGMPGNSTQRACMTDLNNTDLNTFSSHSSQ